MVLNRWLRYHCGLSRLEGEAALVGKANLEDTVCQAHGRRLHTLDSRQSPRPAARRFRRCEWQRKWRSRTWVDVARAEFGVTQVMFTKTILVRHYADAKI